MNGKVIKGDNLQVMAKIQDNYVDSCISDFPYWIEFMGKGWDKGVPYDWCLPRAKELYRIVKNGGYVMIFGHHKTNHRMKCAFEDAGFNIVEEIDWIYATGFPKNQDIGKLFDKKVGAKREIVGKRVHPTLKNNPNVKSKAFHVESLESDKSMESWDITAPASELAQKWDGWKTAGLKPAKEIITVFQKPLEGSYTDNIEKWGCGGMNINACRIEYANDNDLDMLKAKCNFSENSKSIGFGTSDTLYGTGITPLEQARECVKSEGRFPPNIIFDEFAGKLLDEQTGITKSSGGSGDKSGKGLGKSIYGAFEHKEQASHTGGLGDVGGGSRFFYCAKPSPSEKKLFDGTKNTHVTVKPVALIKWLIKLVTPKDGITLDITAGSCTHGVACEELNKTEGYSLKWCNIEMDEDEKGNSLGHIEIGKKRLKEYEVF